MRILVLIALSIAAGLFLGIGSTWARYGWVSTASDLAATAGRPRPAFAPEFAPEHGPQPKVVVDKEDHDFGPVEREATVRHAFVLTNQGDYTLVLHKGGTSCMKCTLAALPKSQVQPGESVRVTVDYHAAIPNGPFRQTAIILTNDRARPRVELTVQGRVTSSFRAMPEELALSTFSAGEAKSGEFRLLSYVSDNFAVVSHEMLDAETADHYSVETTPLAAADLPDPEAKSGCLVKVTVKPGLPLGPLQQKIRLVTNQKQTDGIEVPVHGTVASDISILGKDWNAEQAVLVLGDVKSSEGAVRNLTIWARGPYRHETKFSVGKNSDPGLHVTLGEPQVISSGVSVRVPLRIEVPRGAASVNHLGTQLGKLARVTIETTHPDAKTLPVYVQYAVEP